VLTLFCQTFKKPSLPPVFLASGKRQVTLLVNNFIYEV
jgi:hypothetical protein